MSSETTTNWSPEQWRTCTRIDQQPDWPDLEALDAAVARLRTLTPLVPPHEADAVLEQVASAGRGESVLAQVGDCAEAFTDDPAAAAATRAAALHGLADDLSRAVGRPVVRMVRAAGQYAKPRSSPVGT